MMAEPAGARLLILESHPVQYHAPVYRELARLRPGRVHVAYATDCSVRGHRDLGFGRTVAWDVPLLDGYAHTILQAERGVPLQGARSLPGRGVPALMRAIRPSAVLFTNFAYEFEWVAYVYCLTHRIPIWLRTETQDEAFRRGRLKSIVRSLVYRSLYAPIDRFFCVGELNRRHYLAHGVPERKLGYSRYCVPDAFGRFSVQEKNARRARLRASLGFQGEDCVVSFFGKLIPKKNPAILIKAWSTLAESQRAPIKLLMVGEGELRSVVEAEARKQRCPAVFTGFVNQSELPDYYLAADVVVLPSRRAGETWGLVVNEALFAGCAVILSEAVGCGEEFGSLDQVRTIPVDDATQLAAAFVQLAEQPRDFDWARSKMAEYSVAAAARGLAEAMPR